MQDVGLLDNVCMAPVYRARMEAFIVFAILDFTVQLVPYLVISSSVPSKFTYNKIGFGSCMELKFCVYFDIRAVDLIALLLPGRLVLFRPV